MSSSGSGHRSQLEAARVIETIEKLARRIEERFPEAGLIQACEELLRLSKETRERAAWIARPIVGLRLAAGVMIVLIVAALAGVLSQVRVEISLFAASQLVPLINAALNNMVLLAAAIFFLITIESRVKTRRALAAIHELRSLAHVIDMHQLTKDPDRLLFDGSETESSPSNSMNRFEMSRYLDYCSEMLSLIGKIASIYSLHWRDESAVQAVNEVERLTGSLSQKILHKILILHGANFSNRVAIPGVPCQITVHDR